MTQLFSSGVQSIGVSASTSVLPMNIQDWFPSGWTGWISLQSKGLSRVFSNTFFTTTFLNSRHDDFLDGILQLMVNKALCLIHPHISFSAPQLKRVFEDLPYFLKASQCLLMKSKFLPNQPSPSPSALSSPNTLSLALCASATVAFFAVLPWHWALLHYFGLDFLIGETVMEILVHVVYWEKDFKTKLKEREESWRENGKDTGELRCHWKLGAAKWPHSPTYSKASTLYRSVHQSLAVVHPLGRTWSQAFSSSWGQLHLWADSSQHSQLGNRCLGPGRESRQSITGFTKPILGTCLNYSFCQKHPPFRSWCL